MLRGLMLLLSLILPAAAAVPVTTLDAERFICLDGQRFFPLGFYHVTSDGVTSQAAADQRNADLQAMSTAGFTAMEPIVSLDDVGWSAFLDLAQTRNMRLVAHVPWNVLSANVNGMKSKPAIFAWNIGDDVNWVSNGVNGVNFMSPSQLLTRHNQVRSLDPSRLTFAAAIGSPTLALATYAGSVDIMGIESYPIGNEPASAALESNAAFYAYAQSSFAGTATTWVALPQTFAWSGQAYPTADEYRNLVYAALVKGARGLIDYTFVDSSTNLPVTAPALWTACQTVQGEMQNLLADLRDGQRSELATGIVNIHAATWTRGATVTVVVLNTHRTQSRTVALTMPAGCTGPAQAVFAGRPSGLVFHGGSLGGTIAPDAVHVYRLSRNAGPGVTASAAAAPAALTLP